MPLMLPAMSTSTAPRNCTNHEFDERVDAIAQSSTCRMERGRLYAHLMYLPLRQPSRALAF